LEFRAKLFAYERPSREKMIVALSDSLIQDREPVERAKAVVSQLLNQPDLDIKPILADITAAHWHIDPKQLLVIDHI
jgi:hypothetical protein